ncbi:SulP family inorganic anion transporter [Hamadaea tsunoensis]|uniref:SulP family inorganic anion transporter n=1 Tax=Hamadaea tsunoensis TaxID=53368 RepID=UPI000426B3FF|nr:SulP family inorganic anion transporter [Hamadaea tsunoensis]
MSLSGVLRSDGVAALTAVALLAPETVAFAQLAGIAPAQGLAAAPLCVIAYAVLGRSRQLIVGATAATAVLTSAAVAGLASDPVHRSAYAVALALLTGAILVVTGLLRCGFIARFLAPEALRGFLFGLAVVIVVRQAAVMVDVHTRDGNVFVRGHDILRAHSGWSLVSLAVGVVALAALYLLERRLPRVPSSLIVLVAAAAAAYALGLHRYGLHHVPQVPAGLPLVRLPHLTAGAWLHLLPAAAGLALITFVLGHGVADRLRDDDQPALDANREMTGLGVANLLAGLVGGAAVTGSPSASTAAAGAGARTRWLPIMSAGLLLVVAVWLTPLFTYLPEPVLAAVVIMAVRPFLSLAPLRTYYRRDRRAFAVAMAAVLGVVTLTLLPGLLLAVALSLLIFIADAGHLRVSELGRSADGAYLALDAHPDLRTFAGQVILRPDGPLFFATTGQLRAAVDAAVAGVPRRVVILDLTASFSLRLSVVDALIALHRRLAADGRDLYFVHLYRNANVAVSASDLAAVPAFTTIDAAVQAAITPTERR